MTRRPLSTRPLHILLFALLLFCSAGRVQAQSSTVPSPVPGTIPPIPEELAPLTAPPARHPVQDDIFYFVMPDRFANGDPTNDTGGIDGDRLEHGFDPSAKGFFHGGDLAGLMERLDYLEGLGISAIWMTPVFKNRPVQGSGDAVSAAYHGYWITDFTQFDPHFGTNQELEELISAAHARGMKIFFDIITNHTADVILYEEGQYGYLFKEDAPYRDAEGNVFDDRDYLGGTATFPLLDPDVSFPYTPVFATDSDSTIKVPAWLNNPIYYHNRGDSTFSGENSTYGDFFGLDDLFTEHPDVIDGMIDIYSYWVQNYAIDGFRIDTVKHVNVEFWEHFSPAILAAAAQETETSAGNPDFFFFGEVYSGDARLLSLYPTETAMPAALDFRFQEAVRSYVSRSGSADGLRGFFEGDDIFIDADSNASMLPVFIGNHDMGRFGWFLDVDNSGALSDEEMLARSELAHALMYFARGVPVIYYGDEQGFVGDGGDQDSRQDMFGSVVDSYNDDDLIGTDATTADENFDTAHPLYSSLADFADLFNDHTALRTGAQIHRYSSDGTGVYAFSRIDRNELVEYLVAVNNSTVPQSATFATASPNTTFRPIYPNAEITVESDGSGTITVDVDGLGFTVLRADSALPESDAAPAVALVDLEEGQSVPQIIDSIDGNRVPRRLEVRAMVDSPARTWMPFVEVTFAVRESGTESYTVIGTDDNPPYRVFYDITDHPAGTALDFLAVVNDLHGHQAADAVTNIVLISPDDPAGAPEYDQAIIHYQRVDGDYGDPSTGSYIDYWGLHLWGNAIDPAGVTEWTAPKPFVGEDDYGRYAEIALRDSSQPVNFIVHRGDVKDGTEADRSFTPAVDGPEIWLKEDDPAFYTSLAAAQGYVTIHYSRPDGDYGEPSNNFNDFWGLHLWGDGLADGASTEWTQPRPPDGSDDFGIYWTVPIAHADASVNFIVHRGDEKDPGPDQQMDPAAGGDAYVVSGDETVYGSLEEIEE